MRNNKVTITSLHYYILISAQGFLISSIIINFLFNIKMFDSFLAFGFILNIIMLLSTDNLIKEIKLNKKTISNIQTFTKDLNIFSAIFFVIFGTYSAYIFLLSDKNIVSPIFSGLWLLSLIFLFQICIYYLITYLLSRKISQTKISKTYLILYFLSSAIFGWTSANLAKEVLDIPKYLDLTIAVFGTLILPYLYARILLNKFKL